MAADIAKIPDGLQQKADRSVEAVSKLKQVSKEQNELIMQTKKIFDDIIVKMNEVNSNANLVNDKISDILTSNNRIVESINEISAVSQQTTAGTQETSAMTSRNIEQAGLAKKLVKELIDTSGEMDKYMC